MLILTSQLFYHVALQKFLGGNKCSTKRNKTFLPLAQLSESYNGMTLIFYANSSSSRSKDK